VSVLIKALRRVLGEVETKTVSMTLYHGSPTEVKQFDHLRGDGQFGRGLYLTPDRSWAEFYARGGRQGSAGQKLGHKGHVYAITVAGRCAIVTDIEETAKDVIDTNEEAEEAFRNYGELSSSRVTRYFATWAKDELGVVLLWINETDGGVLSPTEQVLVLDKSAIKKTEKLIQETR
jgi:hypothetical protein